MSHLLDTNICAAHFRRPAGLAHRFFQFGGGLFVPTIVLGELYAGAYHVAKRMRRFDWATDLRYETGRKETGETNGLLRTARAIHEWVEGQIS